MKSHIKSYRNLSRGSMQSALDKVIYTGEPTTDCVISTAKKCPKGYGYVSINAVHVKAHRLAYCVANNIELISIKDKIIMHTCDNPGCINPAHLVLGTVAENNADRAVKGRTVTRVGSQSNMAKLTEDIVRTIRVDARTTEYKILAAKYNVSFYCIWCVVNRKTWKHVI